MSNNMRSKNNISKFYKDKNEINCFVKIKI